MAWSTPAWFYLWVESYLCSPYGNCSFCPSVFQNFENCASGTCSCCMIIVLSCFSSFKRILQIIPERWPQQHFSKISWTILPICCLLVGCRNLPCIITFLGPVGLVSSNLAYFLPVVCDLSIRRVGFTNRNFENWAFGRRFPSGFVVVGCFSRFGLFIHEGHIFFVFCCIESTFKSVARFLPNLRISQNTGEGLGRRGFGQQIDR